MPTGQFPPDTLGRMRLRVQEVTQNTGAYTCGLATITTSGKQNTNSFFGFMEKAKNHINFVDVEPFLQGHSTCGCAEPWGAHARSGQVRAHSTTTIASP